MMQPTFSLADMDADMARRLSLVNFGLDSSLLVASLARPWLQPTNNFTRNTQLLLSTCSPLRRIADERTSLMVDLEFKMAAADPEYVARAPPLRFAARLPARVGTTPCRSKLLLHSSFG